MASPLAHIAVGAAVAVVLAPRVAPRGFFIVVCLLSLFPDAILNFAGDWAGLLTKPVAPQLGSSILVALVIGTVVTLLFHAFAGRERFGHLHTDGHSLSIRRGVLLFTAVILASATVNGFANEPLYYLWPFDAAPYVPGAEVLKPWFPNPIRVGLLQELLYVLLPCLVIALAVALFRERISRPPRIPDDLTHDSADRLAK